MPLHAVMHTRVVYDEPGSSIYPVENVGCSYKCALGHCRRICVNDITPARNESQSGRRDHFGELGRKAEVVGQMKEHWFPSADSSSNSNSRNSKATLADLMVRGSESQFAECSLSDGRYLKSFDGQHYTIPLTDCYTTLAKDCSSNKPLFYVSAKKQSNGAVKVKMLAYTKTMEISLREPSSSEIVIKVDHTQLTPNEYKEHGIHVIKLSDDRKIYVFHCELTGMELRFDGVSLTVRLTNQFVNKQCGVCGHYNLDSEDELTIDRSNGERAKSIREFHRTYLEMDGKCDASKLVGRQSARGRNSESRQREESMEDSEYFFRNTKGAKKGKWYGEEEEDQTEVNRDDETYSSSSVNQPKRSRGSNSDWNNSYERDNRRDSQESGSNQRRTQYEKNQYSNKEENDSYSSQERDFFDNSEEEKNSSEMEGSRTNSRIYGSEEDEENARITYPKPETIVEELEDFVCFSIRKVPQCPPRSRRPTSSNASKKSVDFKCIRRYSHEAQQKMKEKRKTGYVANVDGLDVPARSKTIMVPKKCISV